MKITKPFEDFQLSTIRVIPSNFLFTEFQPLEKRKKNAIMQMPAVSVEWK